MSPFSKDNKQLLKYILPDGTEIALGEERYMAPELLFYPDKLGYEFMGIHEMLVSSINKADIDLRKDLYEAIYIAGAGSKFPGLPARILAELKNKKTETLKIKIFAPNDREFSCFSGGSILSSLKSFTDEMWITKKAYKEFGPNIMQMKTF